MTRAAGKPAGGGVGGSIEVGAGDEGAAEVGAGDEGAGDVGAGARRRHRTRGPRA